MNTAADAKYTLDFPYDHATLSRVGNDLVFTFDDAASIHLTDFYTNYNSDTVPGFEVGGELISGTEFFAALAPDLAPAAGPSAVERSSRYTEHGNAELAAGVSHLDGLDYNSEGSSFQSVPLLMSGVGASEGDSSATGGNGEAALTTYHTRLIVTATSQNTFSFFAVNQSGDLVDDPSQISWAFEGPNAYFTVTGIGADGKITVELTAAGLAALNNGTFASDMLLITIDGVEYKMPLVISGGTAGQSYDAATEESRAQLGEDLKAEWYASDARTVSGESVTLGGTSYNRVDIDRSDAGGAGNIGVWNSDIDITASAKGAVNITAQHNTGSAYGLATYENSGQASSSVRGGEESSIHISAQTTGTAGTAWGVYTNSNQGAAVATTVEGGDITIEAHGNMAGSGGVYTWAGGGRQAQTTIQADRDLTIIADSQQDSSVRSVYATGSGAAIILSAGPDGRLQVSANLESSSQEYFNTENGGSFAALGLSSHNGGTISATGSDITVEASVSDASVHGTAASVYSGYNGAKTTINGYNGQDNTISIHAAAPDHAMGVIGTNSGTVAINGGDGNDTVSISSEAAHGSSMGVAAQAGGQVTITGNGGHDELHIDATFNGPAKSGTTELFGSARGAYGMASAWGGSWVKVDGFEKINVTADARGSGGAAYGMYTHDGWGESVGNSIKYTEGSLHATISGLADNPSKGHSMYSYTGVNSIQGGSKLGDADGDKITLNGHMTITGNSGKNLVTTGDGDDTVALNGDMHAASNGTLNKIETGLGDDVIRVSGEMYASDTAGANAILAGEGDNQIELGGGMRGVGSNTITVGSGSSTITLGGSMSASGTSGVNTIQGDASGGTVVNVNGLGAALYATAGGKNIISDVHDVHVDSGYIHATGSGSSNKIANIAGAVTTTMLAASDGGRNDVTNVGSLDIQATGSGSMGVYAGKNATNNVEANGGIDISAQSTSGGTWGLMAGSLGGNATNSLKAGADINITAAGNGTSASAIDNNSGNTTHVESTGGDVNLKATSTSSGVGGIWGIGSTTVTAGKNLTIETSTQGAAEAGGVHTGGTTTLTALDGDVTVRAEGNIASGLYTISTGTTTVSASGLVDIQAHGKSGGYYIHGGNATALYAESQNPGQLAQNIIKGREVSITADTLQSGDTYALYSNTALNTITSDTQATVTAENHGSGNTWGMYATSTNNKLGANEITGHDVTVSSTAANGNAYAMQASSTTGDSSNTVTLTGGNADISAASAHGNAYAMRADGRATNTITGSGDVTLTGTAAEGSGCGIYASASGSNIIATSGDVSVTGSGYRAAGLNADQNATNAINAGGGIDINAQATSGGTWGLMAGVLNGNANNSLKAGADINITAAGNGTSASAIDNNSGNTTHVESTGGDVNLKATSTSSRVGGIWGIGSTTVTAGKNLTIETSTQGAAEAGGVHTGGTTTLTALDGDVTVRAEGNIASGLYTISTGTTTVSASGLVDIQAHGKSGGYYIHGGNATALYAESQNPGQLAQNIIEGREVSITADTLQSGDTYALYSNTALNTITSDTQATVTAENHGSGNTWGMYATSTNNKLGANEITGHDVTVSSTAANGNAYAMQASSTTGDSSNTVTLTGGTADISAASTQKNAYAMHAEGRGTNTITGNGDVNVTGESAAGSGYGMFAASSGSSNKINTGSGHVTVSGNGAVTGSGMHAVAGSNSINTGSGDVTVSGNSSSTGSGYGYGMFAESRGSNSIATEGGSVNVSGSNSNNDRSEYVYGMYAVSSNSKNSITTESGDVTVSGNVAGIKAAISGSNSIVTESGNVTITGSSSGSGYSLSATDSGSNSIITGSGNVTVSGNSTSSLYSLYATNFGSNSISTESGAVSVTGSGSGSGGGSGMYAASSGSNNITTENGAVTVAGSTGTGSAFGMFASSSGHNSITTEGGVVTVSGTAAGGFGYGMKAVDFGSNTIQSSSGALTVTITATADTANKAIAMWAEGGGAVNYITGHSQAGGAGDNIILTANNGQGVAMQALNGGKNIIATGAGNDSVTVNGAVNGSGNEINLGGGDNTLIINGAVQAGSLNVIADGGTYTLILQASDTESFAVRYGAWLNGIHSDALIAGGITGIGFHGLDVLALPSDFLSTFNDLLWALRDDVPISPPELVDHLHAPVAHSAEPAAMFAETDAEHHMQEAQHAAGHDDMQDSHASAHDGLAHMTNDSPESAFDMHAGATAATADGLDLDATVQVSLAEDEGVASPVTPLFSFLGDHGGSTIFEKGAATLGNSTEMDEGDTLHADITLTHGDDSLDNLFWGAGQQAAGDGADTLYGSPTVDVYEMDLTGFEGILDQGRLAESASPNAPVFSENIVASASGASSVPGIMDSCQETTDNAARQMANG
ncbi:MAG: hypothetical protein BCS36_05525 [Desulfovibrio sp. MES5]|nr:MAG: hypothetical protein BCS36_05525 [Desulfovibrio sp. MES5]